MSGWSLLVALCLSECFVLVSFLLMYFDQNFTKVLLVSVNFGCFSPNRCEHFHCNDIRKANKNLYTIQ